MAQNQACQTIRSNHQKEDTPTSPRVYQNVFTSTYLLATILDTSYPPPDILHSGELNKPNIRKPAKEEDKEPEKAEENKKNDKTKTKK